MQRVAAGIMWRELITCATFCYIAKHETVYSSWHYSRWAVAGGKHRIGPNFKSFGPLVGRASARRDFAFQRQGLSVRKESRHWRDLFLQRRRTGEDCQHYKDRGNDRSVRARCRRSGEVDRRVGAYQSRALRWLRNPAGTLRRTAFDSAR